MSAVLAMVEQEEDRLEHHLENWARWMRSGGFTELQAPSRAAGCTSWGDAWDDETVYEANDRRCAVIMDAMVKSLVPAQKAAIHKRYLHAVFQFPRDNYAEQLTLAKVKLRSMMHGRGLV